MKGKRAAVLGAGVSNMPLIRLLAEAGANIIVHDRKTQEALGEKYGELRALGVSFCLGERYLDEISADMIFRSPGIRPDAGGIQRAVRAGAELTSEMEQFLQLCPCPVIAVTGSDGKTTTTTLVAEMLTRAGRRCHLGGNIGTPLLDRVPAMREGDVAVVELSSFQLMTMKKSPERAVITNITPNHLNWHADMDEYTRAKRNIIAHQDKHGIAVLNADNDVTRDAARLCHGEVRMFSRRGPVENGYYAQNGKIYQSAGGQTHCVMEETDIFLPGKHNVENYMAAMCAVKGLCGEGAMLETAREFRGVPHRIELICEKGGVRYFNDSIASSPARAIAGLRSFEQKVILIAGGEDKHVPFDAFGREVAERAKALILVGLPHEKLKDGKPRAADAIRRAVEAAEGFAPEKLPIYDFYTMKDAVAKAHEIARRGDVVLLSPACTSFDMYENFVQRGEDFSALVRAL